MNYVHCQIEVKQEGFQQGCLPTKTKNGWKLEGKNGANTREWLYASQTSIKSILLAVRQRNKKDIPPIRSSNNIKVGSKLLQSMLEKIRQHRKKIQLAWCNCRNTNGQGIKRRKKIASCSWRWLQIWKKIAGTRLITPPSKNYRVTSLQRKHMQLGSSTSDALRKTSLPKT